MKLFLKEMIIRLKGESLIEITSVMFICSNPTDVRIKIRHYSLVSVFSFRDWGNIIDICIFIKPNYYDTNVIMLNVLLTFHNTHISL